MAVLPGYDQCLDGGGFYRRYLGRNRVENERNSIARTWALLVTAAILYIPANVLPIMKVTSLGKAQSDTIMSGVIYFLKTGSWHLALLIFFASIVVPVLKMIALSYLLISVQRRSYWRPEDRTRLYRITERWGAGPWWMSTW